MDTRLSPALKSPTSSRPLLSDTDDLPLGLKTRFIDADTLSDKVRDVMKMEWP
jgi:hypothetical protein